MINPVTLSGEKVVKSGRCQVKVNPGMGLWPPLDLAEIAANIRQKVDNLRIMDFAAMGTEFEGMFGQVAGFNPDVLVLECSTPTLMDDLTAARRIKNILPGIKNVFFGLHATARPEDILGEDVPFVIRGEPEAAMQELMDYFKNGGELSGIAGLSYFSGGKVSHNKAREPVEDLDMLSFAARDLLNEEYILPTLQEPFTIIRTGRGCPHQCIFCTSGVYYGPFYRTRSAQNIVSEIKEVVNKHGISNFVFICDTFNISERFVLDLCRLIKEERLNIRWASNGRVDAVTEEMCREMKEAGCWLVSLGAESGSNEILRNSKKGITVEQSKKAVEMNRRFGIKTLCYFIFGLPGENEETIERTIAFSKEADPDYAHFYTATPFPGTRFYEMAQENGSLISHDWRRFFHGESDVISYPDLSSHKIADAVRRGYRSFYLRPRVIARELMSVSSYRQLKGFLKTGFSMLPALFSGGRKVESAGDDSGRLG